MHPSKWLRASDLGGKDVSVKIRAIQVEEIGEGDDAKSKPVAYFEGHEKGLVLNKTNTATLTTLFGDEVEGVIGNTVVLYETQVNFKGTMTNAVRIRNAPVSVEAVGKDIDDEIPF